MPLDGALVIRVIDIYGQAISEPADLSVSRKDGPVVFHQAKFDIRKMLRITDLNQGPGAFFQVSVDAPSYLPVSSFVNLRAAGAELTLTLPFRPGAVRSVQFEDYAELPPEARALLDSNAYAALDNERKAGLLNIIAKAGKTVLPGNRTVLSYLTRLIRPERDRVIAEVAPELVEAARRAEGAGLFRVVPSGLHTPPPGYAHGPSYKTMDHYGNLQVTLFLCESKPPVADIDIDNAAGLEHVFQVTSNAIHGPTHPYDIQAILLATQHIDTHYRLFTAETPQQAAG